MIEVLGDVLGGIARIAKITARAAVKGVAGRQAGRAQRDP